MLALGDAWGGTALAYATDWPPTFWIVMLSSLGYFLTFAKAVVAPEGGSSRFSRRKTGGNGGAPAIKSQ